MGSLGGTKLVEHTFRVFAKELETESLADQRQRISDNLACLMTEAELNSQSMATKKSTACIILSSIRSTTTSFTPPAPTPSPTPSPGHPSKLCLATKPGVDHTHSIATCSQLNLQEIRGVAKKQVNRAVITEDDGTCVEHEYPVYNDSMEEEHDSTGDPAAANQVGSMANTCLTQVSPCQMVRIHRVNQHH